MRIKDYKYKSTFASKIRKISGAEVDKYLNLANLNDLKRLMPASIDLDANPDLIGIVGNSCVGNIMNRNGDCISNETAIKIAKNFIWKYVDVSHKRTSLVGTICNAGFSKYGSNDVITEEEALKTAEPINVSLAMVVYKTVVNDKFIEYLEASVDESNPDYQAISLSWEILFNSYDIVVGNKYLNESKIVTDESEKSKLESFLTVNNGSGKDKEGNLIYRLIKDDYLIPCGVGLVENPAAFVKGVEIVAEEDVKNSETQENEAKTSQTENSDVIINDNKINKEPEKIMKQGKKISKLDEITDATLQECVASNVVDFINESLLEANKTWKTQVETKENEIKDINAKYVLSVAETEKTKKDLTDLTVKFTELNEKVIASENQAKFDSRMEYFVSEYELNDEYKKIIANDIATLSDEDFAKYQTKASILFKHLNKKDLSTKAEKEKADKEAALASVKTEVNNASEKGKEAVSDALKNATSSNGELPNGTSVGTTLADKFKKAFSLENCIPGTKTK